MNRRASPPRHQSTPRVSTLGYTSQPTLAPKNAPTSRPSFVYGTAWKRNATSGLVYKAIKAGFRAIDTANQPKHYYEPGVGDGIQQAITDGIISGREDLYIQTKFTSISGQDPNNMPYSASQSLQEQVQESVKKSLKHLQTDYIDCLVLHGPLHTFQDTMTVWSEMEKFVDNGTVLALGISNIPTIDALQRIFTESTYKPTVVQNRFYSETNYDKDIRTFCREQGIQYQSFWTLTANPHIVRSPVVQDIASSKGISPESVFYRWVMSQGCQVLNGTTSDQHMKEDLDALQIQLNDGEIHEIAKLI